MQDNDLLMSLLESTLTYPVEERESYLRSACAENPELFRQVWNYVQWEERMKGFLLEPLCRPILQEHPFEAGDLLDDRFRIVREVAQGGMGVVYEAFDERLERRIAIKCAKAGFRRRLPPEVRHAREISQPNVCKIYEIHTASTPRGKIDFLTMEFLEGETLAERIRKSPLPEAQARLIALQLCAGLAEAHRSHVIHGDLKSNNVILTTDADGSIRAVITDFGLARTPRGSQASSTSGTRGGTPAYMAPELLKGGEPSILSDIYALGVILYELTSGKRPVSGENRSGDSTSDRAPSQWDRVVRRCLDPDPSRRLGSASEVAEALKPPSRRRFLTAVAASGAAVTGGAIWHYLGGRSAAAIPSVAVIPFVNTQARPELQYLTEGISENLINALAQLSDVKVIARASSFQFRGEGIDVKKTAHRLGVKALVTGQISEADGQLRITAELVNGSDGTQLWSGQYSPRMSQVADTEAKITRDTALQIRSRLSNSEQLLFGQRVKTNPAAYELFLRARYLARLHNPESSIDAMNTYQAALAIDPGFALAHAGLAYEYRLLAGSAIFNARDMLPKAEAEVSRALATDPVLAEAHAVLADIRKDQWDWAGAEREYRRAIDLSSSLAVAREGFAIYLSVMGRFDEGIAQVEKARELDPLGVPTAVDAAAVYYNARRYKQSLDVLNLALDLDPSASVAWRWIGIVNGGSGQFENATSAYKKAIELGDNTTATLCYQAYSLVRSGRRQAALQILEQLKRSDQFVSGTALAVLYLGLDDPERALRELQAAYAARDPLIQYLKVESHFDALSSDPRFRELCAKIGLPR